MDTGSLITGLIFIAICAFPFILIKNNNRKREKKLRQNLTDFAAQHNGSISRHDVWNKSAIGIDDTTDTIYYTRSAKDREITEMIQLADVQKCQYIKNSKSGGGHDGGFRATDTLELAFIARDKNRPETVLEMYNAAYDPMTLTVELQLAQKWSEMVNDAISENK